MTGASRVEGALLALILLVGAGLRCWLLLGPFREIDADEAVVGLMALQMPGELPAFYWQQAYLGTLEPLTAWVIFALVGPSTAALKAVPALYSLLFIGLLYLAARRAFGAGAALLAALYLAVPPSFFAAWSVKARGGYPEALALGTVCLLAAQRLAGLGGPDADAGATAGRDGSPPSPTRGRRRHRWALAFGLAAGLALWTHPMSIVFVAAGALYVGLTWRGVAASAGRPGGRPVRAIGWPAAAPWLPLTVGLIAVGGIVGLLPAVLHNLVNGFPSLRFAAEGGTEPRAALLNLWGFVRYGLPVLAGLAEGTPTRELLLQDWPTRPGSSPLVTVVLPVLGLALVWWHRRSLAALWRGGPPAAARGPALFVLVLLLVPPFIAVSRFANLWAEPRYALPIYAIVPLATAAAVATWRRSQPLGGLLVAAALGLNLFSLATSDYRLSLPINAGESTAASRAVLIAALRQRGIDRIYTDYWLAYPLAFESCEAIVPSVWSGGFGRRAAYSHLVFTAPRPAFVFPRDAPGDVEFRALLAATGGRATVEEIAAYRVYTDVEPLDRLRRP